MYLIIAYHGKGKTEVESDLKKLWFNFSNFTRFVKVRHIYFFQNAKDNFGANLLMIIDYKCVKHCLASKQKSVNYWLYVRDKGQDSRDKKKTSSMPLGS